MIRGRGSTHSRPATGITVSPMRYVAPFVQCSAMDRGEGALTRGCLGAAFGPIVFRPFIAAMSYSGCRTLPVPATTPRARASVKSVTHDNLPLSKAIIARTSGRGGQPTCRFATWPDRRGDWRKINLRFCRPERCCRSRRTDRGSRQCLWWGVRKQLRGISCGRCEPASVIVHVRRGRFDHQERREVGACRCRNSPTLDEHVC